jgi:hypothetical protein
MVLLLPGAARAQLWYDFNEPYATATSSPVMVFDWSTEKCFNEDIPDQPARAFRDSSGQVTLIDTGSFARRKLGSSLGNVKHVCPTIFSSTASPDPSTWDNGEWLASPYTTDGNTVYALIHNEYQGWRYGPGYCVKPGELWADKMKCWYNSITLAKSTDRGATYANAPSPTQYVGSIPYQYSPGVGPSGFFTPSNIVRAKDGYLYVILHVESYGAQQAGACLWRTRDLADPKSWRAWGGAGFTVRFLDPYRNNITDPSKHVCAPVGPTTVQTGSDSLTWNTYFKKWLLARATSGGPGDGFYTYTSDDLINWSPAKLLMNSYLPWKHTCGEPDYNLYPSLLDPATKTRNFERTGQRPYLFFTHFNVAYNSGGCWMSVDRDLLRIPIAFSNQQPGGPSAALAASTTSARAGEPVTFDASGSRDADGSIVRYEWDLDGDGTYERDTGKDPTTSTTYTAPDVVTVTVRVSDNDGNATDETRDVQVEGATPESLAGAAPQSAPVAPPGGAATALARFRVIGVTGARAGRVALRVRVPAAGRLVVRGVRRRAAIRTASAFADGPRTLMLRVRPSRRGHALLARRAHVRVRATVEFTPVGGATQAETRMLVLRGKRH